MTTVPPVPSPRPAEEIRADLAAVDNTSGGLCYSLGGTRRETFRLAHDVAPLLAEVEELRRGLEMTDAEMEGTRRRAERLSAELADARTQLATVVGQLQQCIDERNYRIGERVAAERALEAVRTVAGEIDSGEHATTGRQFGQGMAHAAKLFRAALSAASPTTSDEPARCLHGHTEAHWYPTERYGGWCPGPAASGTPETTE